MYFFKSIFFYYIFSLKAPLLYVQQFTYCLSKLLLSIYLRRTFLIVSLPISNFLCYSVKKKNYMYANFETELFPFGICTNAVFP